MGQGEWYCPALQENFGNYKIMFNFAKNRR